MTFNRLVKKEIKDYLIRPVTYISTAVFVLGINFAFFLSTGFLNGITGTTDLRYFFYYFPLFSVLYIPSLTFSFFSSDKDFYSRLPFSFEKLYLSKIISAFIISIVSLAASIPTVLLTAHFGDINLPNAILSYAALLFFNFAAICFSGYFSFCFENKLSSFLLSVLFLTIFSFIPLIISDIPYLPESLHSFINSFSFAEHFSYASKGILSTRDFLFYALISVFFIMLTFTAHEKKLKKREPLVRIIFLLISAFCISLFISGKYDFHIDFSKDRLFSVSNYSKKLLNKLEDTQSTLEITYFASPDIEKYYPETKNIKDYLHEYASESRYVICNTLKTGNASVSERLKKLGIESQKIQTTDGTNKTVFVDLYSAVLLEYKGYKEIIPFIISNKTLEYELDKKVASLEGKKKPHISVLSGGNLSITQNYPYVVNWLNMAGFSAEEIHLDQLQSLSYYDTSNEILLVFGAENLSENEACLIENFLCNGSSAFFAVSPVSVDINSSWTPSVHENLPLLGLLKSFGFDFIPSLCLSDNCSRLKFIKGTSLSERNEQDSLYLDYQLWPSVKKENLSNHIVTNAFSSLDLFWTVPLKISSPNIESLIKLSADYSLMDKDSFVTDPFLLEKEYQRYKRANGADDSYTVAAAAEGRFTGCFIGKETPDIRLGVISSPYFASNLMETTNSIYNLDFLTNFVHWLADEDELLSVKGKGSFDYSFYKIKDAKQFFDAKLKTLLICLILIPTLIVLSSAVFASIRKREGKKAL